MMLTNKIGFCMFAAALTLNAAAAFSLSLDGELILSVQFPMQGLDAETLGLKLSSFADAAVSVKAEIASACGRHGPKRDPTGLTSHAAICGCS